MKSKNNFKILSYLWLHARTQSKNLAIFPNTFVEMWQLEEKKHTHTHTHTHIFSLFEISFGQITKFSQKKRLTMSSTTLCVSVLHTCLPATVNQHPPPHHEGWMVSGQETIFCWVPVP